MFFYKINVNNKIINPIETIPFEKTWHDSYDLKLRNAMFYKPTKTLYYAQSQLVRNLGVLLYKKIELDGIPSDMDKTDIGNFYGIMHDIVMWCRFADTENEFDDLCVHFEFLCEFASQYFDITAILNIQ